MKTTFITKTALGISLAACAFAWAPTSRAQTVVNNTPAPAAQPVVVVQPQTQRAVTTEQPSGYAGPNRSLLATGLVAFGGTYLASVIVAGTSNHQGDSHLYVPVVGPWLDVGDRGSCTSTFSSNCDPETLNKVLLVGDGVLQGVGVIAIVLSLIVPEERSTVTTTTTAKAEPPKPTLRVLPGSVARGAPGMVLVGSW